MVGQCVGGQSGQCFWSVRRSVGPSVSMQYAVQHALSAGGQARSCVGEQSVARPVSIRTIPAISPPMRILYLPSHSRANSTDSSDKSNPTTTPSRWHTVSRPSTYSKTSSSGATPTWIISIPAIVPRQWLPKCTP